MASATYLKELLLRYKNGDCTPQEVTRLEQWFEQVQHENPISGMLTEADEDRIIQRLIEDPRFNVPVPVINNSTNPGIFRRFSRMSAAVWVGLLLCGGLAAWLIYQNNHSTSATQVAFVEIKTTTGQRQQVVLPDSSVVWLNSQSSLEYHPDFAAHREIRLSGEAFFEVTHDKNHPFTIRAGSAFTKVYGTTFNVTAYSGADELRVALQQGSIGITYDSTQTNGEKILSPGQLFIYDNKTNAVRTIMEKVEDMGGWVSGKLIFNEVSLKEVLAQLERSYKITCRYNTALKNPLVTARFDNASLEKVIEHLSFGWDVHLKRTGDTLYVN